MLLTAYSRGTHGVLTGVLTAIHGITHGGTYGVLTGYSEAACRRHAAQGFLAVSARAFTRAGSSAPARCLPQASTQCAVRRALAQEVVVVCVCVCVCACVCVCVDLQRERVEDRPPVGDVQRRQVERACQWATKRIDPARARRGARMSPSARAGGVSLAEHGLRGVWAGD